MVVLWEQWAHLDPWPVTSWGGLSNVSKCQKMSSCQKDVKVSKNQTPGLWRRFAKKLNWYNEVHRYWCQFWCHIWWSLKTLKMFIESIFGQFWWPSYLMSKLMLISVNLIMSINFFLNLLHSPDVWLFDIWHLFDNLTSFDILTHNLNHCSPSQGYFSCFLNCQRKVILRLLIQVYLWHRKWCPSCKLSLFPHPSRILLCLGHQTVVCWFHYKLWALCCIFVVLWAVQLLLTD